MTARLNSDEQKEVLTALSQQATAWLVGIRPRTLREQDAPRNSDGTYNARAVLQWLADKNQQQQPAAGEPVTNKERLEAAQADLAEMKRDQQAGRLVEREVINEWLSDLAGRLRALGDRLGRRRKLDGRDAQTLVNQLLAEDQWEL